MDIRTKHILHVFKRGSIRIEIFTGNSAVPEAFPFRSASNRLDNNFTHSEEVPDNSLSSRSFSRISFSILIIGVKVVVVFLVPFFRNTLFSFSGEEKMVFFSLENRKNMRSVFVLEKRALCTRVKCAETYERHPLTGRSRRRVASRVGGWGAYCCSGTSTNPTLYSFNLYLYPPRKREKILTIIEENCLLIAFILFFCV